MENKNKFTCVHCRVKFGKASKPNSHGLCDWCFETRMLIILLRKRGRSNEEFAWQCVEVANKLEREFKKRRRER